MRRGRILGTVLVFALASAAPVLADEIVHFTNGTFMPIRSHTIEEGMVRVVLGAESEMAFPVGLVEKIDANGREILISARPANVVEGGVGMASVAPAAADGEEDGEIVDNGRQFTASGENSPRGPAGNNLTAQQRALANVGLAPGGLVNGFVEGGVGGSSLTGGQQGGTPVAHPFANSDNPATRAISTVGNRGLTESRSIGAAPGVPASDGQRGASLQKGGGKLRKD